MLYPIGEYIHQNLSTTFTDVYQLFQELKETRFTGYASIQYWQFEALIIFDSGQIIQSYYKSRDNIVAGLDAYEVILEKVNEKDGSINVVKTDNEITLILASLPYAEEKPQKFVLNDENLVKIQNLLEENAVSAILQAWDENNNIELTLYFYEGQLLSIVGKKANNYFIKSLDDLGELIKLVKMTPFKSSLFYVDISKTVAILEDFSLQATFPRWIEYYSSIFDKIRELTAKDIKEEEFKKILQSSRLELADNYAFLDPFAEIVNFKSTPIEVHDFVNIYQFINGMDYLILKILEKLNDKKLKNITFNGVLFEVKKLNEQFEELIDQLDDTKRVNKKELTGV